jgi:peptidoglycan hydrolase CwlO-like protein
MATCGGKTMTEQIWAPEWIAENPELANKAITELQTLVQELESKLKHANNKIAKLESQNKEYKLTIKDMDRRIMRGLKD